MKFIKYILLVTLLSPILSASNDETSLEECGIIACVFMFEDEFDPEYFDMLNTSAQATVYDETLTGNKAEDV